ncbi:hypothetical protein PYW07_003844 [Mythimna separata]|uniref:FP protein C-terminal domain-containing protein n=1 Tax=Mythimna separata TaxID=271217 RepID=A0AAD8DQS3_MYTSE|nr:hypothetical protein PYW07_002713 [Mythimna separata]KAJ8722664.1 hypothetical protein PYW07_003844 [Mythimna separata]
MPNIQRSPPAGAGMRTQRVMSSPDISTIENEPGHINISSRNKRFKPDSSPGQSPRSENETFEDKIMNLLTTWKSDQDVLLNKLTSDINEVKLQNKEIQRTNIEIEKSIEHINLAYENMRQSVQKLEKERQEQRAYIIELEKKVGDLQNSSRSSSFEIRNIPTSERETTEDLASLVLQTCNVLQVPLKSTDLRDVYRMPGKKGSNRPIVADLIAVPLKKQVLDATRAFNKDRPAAEKLNSTHIGIKGEPKPVYVADHLPNSLRQLFYEARKFASAHDYKFCWSQNNKIFLRKREGMDSVIVSSVSCLANLSKTQQH